MAIPHAKPAQPINVRPFGPELDSAQTTTLIKTDSLEVIRLVLRADKEIAQHDAPGEITLQCLEGTATLRTANESCALAEGDLTYLSGHQVHSLRAETDSSLLLTIVLHPKHVDHGL